MDLLHSITQRGNEPGASLQAVLHLPWQSGNTAGSFPGGSERTFSVKPLLTRIQVFVLHTDLPADCLEPGFLNWLSGFLMGCCCVVQLIFSAAASGSAGTLLLLCLHQPSLPLNLIDRRERDAYSTGALLPAFLRKALHGSPFYLVSFTGMYF